MKLYDKIIKCLEHGVFPIIENKEHNRKYICISDSTGNINGIVFDNDYFNGDSVPLYSTSFYGYEITGYYTFPRKPYEVGQKVQFTDQDIDNDDYRFAKKHLKNKVCYIREVYDNFSGLYYTIHNTPDKAPGLHCIVRHEWLVPVFEEEKCDCKLDGTFVVTPIQTVVYDLCGKDIKQESCKHDWVIYYIDWSISASKYKCRICGKLK